LRTPTYTQLTVDPFAIIVLGCLALGGLCAWMLGTANGSRGQAPGLRSGREIVEDHEALEAEDLQQLLEAHNARRRRRGEQELTVADVELRVSVELDEQRRLRERYLEQRDLEQLLEATNARRRARGLPDRTPEQLQREFGPGDPGRG
jgi:hypothetical protein